MKMQNCHRYKTSLRTPTKNFSRRIDFYPLFHSSTVSIQAIQFILYTNPKRIFIVGIDCNVATSGHFVGAHGAALEDEKAEFERLVRNDKFAIEHYTMFSEFAKINYPKTEIISINPVGLKGIFKDIYTNENGEYIDEYGNRFNIGGVNNETLVY